MQVRGEAIDIGRNNVLAELLRDPFIEGVLLTLKEANELTSLDLIIRAGEFAGVDAKNLESFERRGYLRLKFAKETGLIKVCRLDEQNRKRWSISDKGEHFLEVIK